MKAKYTKPALPEQYLISRKKAEKLVTELCPDMERLVFETRHGPKMSDEALYLATLSRWELRILSVKTENISEPLTSAFTAKVMPDACKRIETYIDTGYDGQTCIVMVDGKIYCVPCSEGQQLPGITEIRHSIKKSPKPICNLRFI